MIAGMVLSNLLYLVGAIVAATVLSGIVFLRHRRPKSLEAGIEMFSRELKALEPDRPGAATGRVSTGATHASGRESAPTRASDLRVSGIWGSRTVTPLVASRSDQPSSSDDAGRGEAGVSPPDRENEPG